MKYLDHHNDALFRFLLVSNLLSIFFFCVSFFFFSLVEKGMVDYDDDHDFFSSIFFPNQRIRLRLMTPPKNPPPPCYKMILRLTLGSKIGLANFFTSYLCLSTNLRICLSTFILPSIIFRAAKENHLIISISPALSFFFFFFFFFFRIRLSTRIVNSPNQVSRCISFWCLCDSRLSFMHTFTFILIDNTQRVLHVLIL